MAEFYFPAPLKAGEFDPALAEQEIHTYGRNDYLAYDRIGIKLNTLGDMVLDTTSERVRFDYDFDPDNNDTEPGVRKWHLDTYSMKNQRPMAFVVGATVRNPDIVTGVMQAPCLPDDYSEKESLAAYLLTEDGQAAVAEAIDLGNLEPVTDYEVGDFLLMLKMSLHRRASTPPEEMNLKNRILFRSFIRE